MININEKLIVSIADEPFENVIKFATNYKKIELRLNKLCINNEQIITIIDSAELVVITDIAELKDTNIFHKINFSNNHLAKIIIDCPVEKIGNKKLTKYIDNPLIKKILSYHSWANNVEIKSIFPYLLEQIGTDISKFHIIKIAVFVENIIQENTLFSYFNTYSDIDFILIPLGKAFQKSRIKSLQLGSKYMFCYINHPITACQLHYEKYLSSYE